MTPAEWTTICAIRDALWGTRTSAETAQAQWRAGQRQLAHITAQDAAAALDALVETEEYPPSVATLIRHVRSIHGQQAERARTTRADTHGLPAHDNPPATQEQRAQHLAAMRRKLACCLVEPREGHKPRAPGYDPEKMAEVKAELAEKARLAEETADA